MFTKEEIGMSFLDTQEFSITEPAGVKIVAFTVNYTNPEKWDGLPICRLEKIEANEKSVDGRCLKTFSIPTEEKEISNVIMVSLAKSRCVIGYGKVAENQFVPEKNTIHLEYTNIGNVEGETLDYKFKFNPKRQMVLIDADTGDQIMPIISKDKNLSEIRGNYKLIPYKNYIAMELAIRPVNNQNMTYEEMSKIIL